MAKKIAVLSQKGGTGKTTAVRHLTDVFRDAGLRVLAIDLDPQGNLSDYFDVPPDAEPTIGDVLTGRAKAKAALQDDIIPANLTLAEAELALAGKMGRELTLKRAVRERLEVGDDRIVDLHLWLVGPGHTAAIIALESAAPEAPSVYKRRLADLPTLSHVTVEVEPRG